MIGRRGFLAGTVGVALAGEARAAVNLPGRSLEAANRIQALETGEARLGVCILDTVSFEAVGNRLHEYFAMCSTFKLGLVGACLREADAGRLDLSETLPYSQTDLLEWAPVTRPNLGQGGMSIAALAQAAQERSDGTAANLLVRRLGGPAALTDKFREMGDPVSRLDRYEPRLGMVLSGDLRDTTSPFAMAELVRQLTTGPLLSDASRATLLEWMVNTQTGARRLRAGLPAGWRAGNKTGTGRDAGITNKCNDVAIVFPPGRSPMVIAAYYDSGEYTEQIEDRHQAVLAAVGRIAADWAIS